jgi:hypothetical protein
MGNERNTDEGHMLRKSHMNMTTFQADNPYRELSEGRMRTAEDRLRWAVEFCQSDVERMRPGDILNARDDLYLFLHGHPNERVFPGGICAFETGGSIREFPLEEMKQLQAEGRAVFHSAAIVSGTKLALPVNVHYTLMRDPIDWKRKVVMEVAGDPRDCFLTVLYHLITQEKVNRLAMCPGCGLIFYRVKKKKYCSVRCGNKVYMREYRAIGGEKDSNHKQYEKRKRARASKAAKVARKRRS